MSYLVLARKHRPQAFDEVIGQDHITDLLKKAIEADRVTQAYLFSGPRGVGKTSCARILAKSLNCEKGSSVNPCGKCSACQEIAKGTSFDVLEIDGASNRGIDEIRTLRENVKFSPSYGKYKIYIVDEVHMLTTEAFNALLKTLEEPPEHVKFIFATTAPNKVPATITSRCQKFDFKRISINIIIEALTQVSKKESFNIDQDALYAIAKAAQGSLRDALSVLDQLSALSEGGGIASTDVFTMLGLVETQLLFDLSDALSQKNCSLCLEILEQIIDKGKDVKQLTKDIIEHFRHLMIIKIGGKSLSKLVDYPVVIKEMLLKQVDQFDIQDILGAIDIFIEAQETARVTESIRMPLEVAFAKLIYNREGAVVRAPLPQSQIKSEAPRVLSPAAVLHDKKGQVDILSAKELVQLQEKNVESRKEKPKVIEQERESVQESILDDVGADDLDIKEIQRLWDTLTHAVSRRKMSVATYLQEGSPIAFDGEKLTIGFLAKCRFQKEALEDQANIVLVSDVFQEKLKRNVRLVYTIEEERMCMEEDKAVQDALDTFQGKVVGRWHNE